VNVELAPIHKLATEVKKVEVGVAFTIIELFVVELHVPLETVNETDLEPELDQETECGPKPVTVAGLAFAPKFHVYVEPEGADPE
jgi:hypothetical protein